ncbi:hypothetical protein OAF82_00025 [bacterium]|nr:hypothetical protein [bacterium]
MDELEDIIGGIIPLAIRWKTATSRSLGITGEVGEYLACKEMGWALADHLQEGWDAEGRDGLRIQIKSRVLQPDKDRSPTMSVLNPDKPWDQAALVLMDENYSMTAIWVADGEQARAAQRACRRPDGKLKGLPIQKFKQISTCVWNSKRSCASPPEIFPMSNCSELADELSSRWNDEDDGKIRAVIPIVFGIELGNQMGPGTGCSIKDVVEKSTMPVGMKGRISDGRALQKSLCMRDEPLEALPDRPVRTRAMLSEELKGMLESERYGGKVATIFVFGVRRATEMAIHRGDELTILKGAGVQENYEQNLRHAQNLALFAEEKP